MTRNNVLYLIIGALVIVTTVLSYQLYQDRKQPEGNESGGQEFESLGRASMRIDLGPDGMSIEKK